MITVPYEMKGRQSRGRVALHGARTCYAVLVVWLSMVKFETACGPPGLTGLGAALRTSRPGKTCDGGLGTPEAAAARRSTGRGRRVRVGRAWTGLAAARGGPCPPAQVSPYSYYRHSTVSSGCKEQGGRCSWAPSPLTNRTLQPTTP
jgi:hypothetical protein